LFGHGSINTTKRYMPVWPRKRFAKAPKLPPMSTHWLSGWGGVLNTPNDSPV